MLGWPEPGSNTVYDRKFGDFPAKNTVYTPYMYVCCTYVYTYVYIHMLTHMYTFANAYIHMSYIYTSCIYRAVRIYTVPCAIRVYIHVRIYTYTPYIHNVYIHMYGSGQPYIL
jgi:hypothetical protein